MPSPSPTVQLQTGAVRGEIVDGVARYLGIPYAAPPFGDDRFRPPRPHEPWEGTLAADHFGPSPPQAPYGGGSERYLPSVVIPGDDVLNVNIWAPVHKPGEPELSRPVMVWIYGGSLTRGSNALATYDGTRFARDGVVLVSINYRVGAEGFSVLRDAPRNLGLADAIAALRWVQQEIANFGGDPRRVTVFGQSAGGGIVAALLALPAAAELFARAIIMSAPLGPAAKPPKKTVTDLIAADLGVAPTREAFAAISPDDLVAAQTRVMNRSNPLLSGGGGYGGVRDKEVTPVDPWTAYKAGAAAGLPVMVGYTTEEYRLFFVPTGMMTRIKRIHLWLAMLRFRISPRIVGRYRRRRPSPSPAEIVGLLITDLMVRVPANRFADIRARHGATTFMYEFAWRSPVDDLGAAHAVDVGFVFDTLDSPEAEPMVGPNPPQALADRMHAAWVRFAMGSDPGWPAWDATRPVMVFDEPGGGLQLAPNDAERAALTKPGVDGD